MLKPNSIDLSPSSPASLSAIGADAVSRSVGWLTRVLRGLVVTVLLGTLQAYKLLLSPLLGRRCRFHPTCSCYAHDSIQRHGPFKGSWYAFCRLLRCGPWHPGGIDEVPPHKSYR